MESVVTTPKRISQNCKQKARQPGFLKTTLIICVRLSSGLLLPIMLSRFAQGFNARRLLKNYLQIEPTDGIGQLVCLSDSRAFLVFAAFFKDLLGTVEKLPHTIAQLLGASSYFWARSAKDERSFKSSKTTLVLNFEVNFLRLLSQ